MKLYNALTKQIELFKPLKSGEVSVYSCGPTVYDHAHIGNLASFIFADTLRRVLSAQNIKVSHVMNFTDIDDKTIAKSKTESGSTEPNEALREVTRKYEAVFLDDTKQVGFDTSAVEFVRATDSIPEILELIRQLHAQGFAYLADDGVYFSIEAYKAAGHIYGRLLEITAKSIGAERVKNDEYDKDHIHDFALWKLRKDDEPFWEFELEGKQLPGRPGWHIECSAMSTHALGQPFDIHTGGIDLLFPHHENEIAQSTGAKGIEYATFFVHNEHVMVDGKKMSKSLNNFYTLSDITEKGFDPLAFRMLILQAHYQTQCSFSWDNLQAASNRLDDLKALADLRWQPVENGYRDSFTFQKAYDLIFSAMLDNLNTPLALKHLNHVLEVAKSGLHANAIEGFSMFLKKFDLLFGFNLFDRADITDEQKTILAEREQARQDKDYAKSDELRQTLSEQGIQVRDTPTGQLWTRPEK